MKQKFTKDIHGGRELGRQELQQTEGGITAIAVILAVGGVAGLAFTYKGLCDGVNEIGQKIGVALAS